MPRLPASARFVPAVLALVVFAVPPAAAQTPQDAAAPPVSTARPTEILDIERLRAVPAGRLPNDTPTCDVLVVGGGLGGVAAAEALADEGLSVILTEPTSHLGGQLTAQGVPVPDENRYIEQTGGPSTERYRWLRAALRARYAAIPGIVAGRAQNVGMCWVSRISGEPGQWEAAVREALGRRIRGSYGIRRILTRHQIVAVQRYAGNGRFAWADVQDLDSGRITRIGAQFVLDATETGDVLPLAGSPYALGQEARAAYNEPDAPPEAHPEWVQSFTYSFALRWTPAPAAGAPPLPIVAPPPDYARFKATGDYTLDYEYSSPTPHTVTYKVKAAAPGSGGPFWTYRRLIAASSFKGNPAYASDVALINWRGNDYAAESWVDKPVPEQRRILTDARNFARGFLYWLQTECPRDDGSGFGYPEMQPAGDVLGDGGGDGIAPAPYIRESRRLLAAATLTENDLLADPARPDPRFGADFPDSVGCALYAIDIHPAAGEEPHLAQALPYQIPLGAFVARSGPPNLLPAAKNVGASRLAAASARMHPTEWLIGEVAGRLAAFCVRRGIDPAQVRASPDLLAAFQSHLERNGIKTRWREILPEEK